MSKGNERYKWNTAEPIRESAEVDDAFVSLEIDTPIRRMVFWILDFIDLWIGGFGGETGRLQIVVRDKSSGDVVWVNHGYTLASDPHSAFETICQEIEYFTLSGFLRRRRRNYWRNRNHD